MSNFKQKFKSAYVESHASGGAKESGSAPNDYYLKLAKTAMRAGIVAAILSFLIAFYGCGLAVVWSVLIAFVAFIVIQPVVGITAVLGGKKSQ